MIDTGAFVYLDTQGKRIKDDAEIRRINALAVPAAYTDVWICPDPRGHMQATGRDARGRKQYRYHPRWRETRDATKYERLLAFGTALPKLRARLFGETKPCHQAARVEGRFRLLIIVEVAVHVARCGSLRRGSDESRVRPKIPLSILTPRISVPADLSRWPSATTLLAAASVSYVSISSVLFVWVQAKVSSASISWSCACTNECAMVPNSGMPDRMFPGTVAVPEKPAR